MDGLEVMKNEANELFKSCDYFSAEILYLKVISSLEDEKLNGEAQLPLYTATLNNLSATLLKLNKNEDVIAYSTKSIQLDSKNIKACYRRATAYFNLGQLEHALIDVDAILAIEANNSQALGLRRQLIAKLEQLRFSQSHRNHTASISANIVESTSHSNSIPLEGLDSTLSGPILIAPGPVDSVSATAPSRKDEYGFMRSDWIPPDAVPGIPTPSSNPDMPGNIPLPVIAPPIQAISEIQHRIAQYTAFTNDKSTGKPKVSLNDALHQLAKSKSTLKETSNILNDTILDEFAKLQTDEVLSKQLFKERISSTCTHTGNDSTGKEVHGIDKSVPVDSHKMHYLPAKYSDGVDDAWKLLAEEEVGNIHKMKQLKQQKAKMQSKRVCK